MKKITALLLVLFVLSAFSSCSKHMGSSGSGTTPMGPSGPGGNLTSETYYNNGKIQSAALITYMGMTITAGQTYYYDSIGKIRKTDQTIMGYSSGSNTYNYTASGLLSGISVPAGASTDNVSYTYDASGHIAARTCVDATSSTTTTDYMIFTTDANGLITRIDETQKGIPSSFRLMIRDANGTLTREDIYAPMAVTPAGYVNYIRDNTLKTVTAQITLMSMLMCEIKASYDSSGFLLSQSVSLLSFGMTYTINNTLQSGLFDSGGQTGYNYTDKDIFGITWIRFSASGVGY